jgi:hypothetical protein
MADDNASCGEQIHHLPQAHREPVIGPYSIGKEMTSRGKRKPFRVGTDGIEIIQSRYDHHKPQSS